MTILSSFLSLSGQEEQRAFIEYAHLEKFGTSEASFQQVNKSSMCVSFAGFFRPYATFETSN